jgi:Tfp pilus assembly protein PilF
MIDSTRLTTKKLEQIIALALIAATLLVYWQVRQFDFITLDDEPYVTANHHVQSGISAEGLRWAFSTTEADFWHPLTWLSLMLNHQWFGLNAGGYHLTNVVLHVLSSLLLFWLMNRMTGALWKSAFVAAFFALHPLRLESVVWIAKRKDVLSVFFWMLTLCLYVYYTSKPVLKRYVMVLLSFVCGLMSKPVVVTLPVVMMLLDWWPLGRQSSSSLTTSSANGPPVNVVKFPLFRKNIREFLVWQLREKLPFFALSFGISMITVYAQFQPWATPLPLSQRLMHAAVVFVSYLWKIFWPYDLAVLCPFPDRIPVWQVAGAVFLIAAVSVAVVAWKRFPFLCVGWLWYAVTVLPVIGISAVGPYFPHLIKDHYTYLPCIGVGIMLAWGMPLLFLREPLRKRILLPAGVAVAVILSALTWQQCRYWQNSEMLFRRAVQVKKNNYLAYNALGDALVKGGRLAEGLIQFDQAIRIKPSFPFSYHNRGLAHVKMGQYQKALDDFNEAIRLKPRYYIAFMNRGTLYGALGQFDLAIRDLTTAIRLQPDFVEAYYNRGYFYAKMGRDREAKEDYHRVMSLNPNFMDE